MRWIKRADYDAAQHGRSMGKTVSEMDLGQDSRARDRGVGVRGLGEWLSVSHERSCTIVISTKTQRCI